MPEPEMQYPYLEQTTKGWENMDPVVQRGVMRVGPKTRRHEEKAWVLWEAFFSKIGYYAWWRSGKLDQYTLCGVEG